MQPRMRGLACIAMAIGIASTSGCAVGNSNRRRLLNYLDEHLTPSSTTGRWVASPVALPLGFVAGVTDAVLLHPSTQFDDAWGDTVDLLWTPGDQTPFRRAVMAPVSVVLTPVVFVGDWLTRAVFNIPDREED